MNKLELHGNDFGDAGLFHGYAVEPLHHLHTLLIMGDKNKLAYMRDIADKGIKALYVGFIKGGVHLVKEAEWAGFYQEDGEYEGYCGEGLFAA